MPHIIVKMYPGRTREDKQLLADSLALLLHDTLGYQPENVSVSVVEVEPSRWMRDVYDTDIANGDGTMVRLPSYGPHAARA